MTGLPIEAIMYYLEGQEGLEKQLNALQELCELLDLAETEDWDYFERCPPRLFLPKLCQIFANITMRDNTGMLMAIRAINRYLAIAPVECVHHVVAVEGVVKTICNCISAGTTQQLCNTCDSVYENVTQQCMKVMEIICAWKADAVFKADGLFCALHFIRQRGTRAPLDTLNSAIAIITQLCDKVEPQDKALPTYVEHLSFLIGYGTPDIADGALTCFVTIAEKFLTRQTDPTLLTSSGVLERILTRPLLLSRLKHWESQGEEESYRRAMAYIRSNDTEALMQAIAQEEISIDTTDNFGQTLLVWASAHSTPQMVEFLCKTGADVNKVQQSSSLHVAARRGRPNIVKILLKYGANPHLRDGEGKTAFDRAMDGFDQGHRQVANILQSTWAFDFTSPLPRMSQQPDENFGSNVIDATSRNEGGAATAATAQIAPASLNILLSLCRETLRSMTVLPIVVDEAIQNLIVKLEGHVQPASVLPQESHYDGDEAACATVSKKEVNESHSIAAMEEQQPEVESCIKNSPCSTASTKLRCPWHGLPVIRCQDCRSDNSYDDVPRISQASTMTYRESPESRTEKEEASTGVEVASPSREQPCGPRLASISHLPESINDLCISTTSSLSLSSTMDLPADRQKPVKHKQDEQPPIEESLSIEAPVCHDDSSSQSGPSLPAKRSCRYHCNMCIYWLHDVTGQIKSV